MNLTDSVFLALGLGIIIMAVGGILVVLLDILEEEEDRK